MSARVELGLDSLRDELRRLPQQLAQEANAIVAAHAEDARRQVQDGYPQGSTGNLRRGVTMQVQSSRFGGVAVVRSRAPHAWMAENGTKVRHTSKGYNRGSMPQVPASSRMLPKVIQQRRRMYQALKAMVERHGLTVQETAS